MVNISSEKKGLKSKSLSRTVKIEFTGFLVILGFVATVFGMYIFSSGYHSVDLAHNMDVLNAEFGLNIVDQTLQGKVLTPIQAYSTGWWQVRSGAMLMIAGSLLFGAVLVDMMWLAHDG